MLTELLLWTRTPTMCEEEEEEAATAMG